MTRGQWWAGAMMLQGTRFTGSQSVYQRHRSDTRLWQALVCVTGNLSGKPLCAGMGTVAASHLHKMQKFSAHYHFRGAASHCMLLVDNVRLLPACRCAKHQLTACGGGGAAKALQPGLQAAASACCGWALAGHPCGAVLWAARCEWRRQVHHFQDGHRCALRCQPLITRPSLCFWLVNVLLTRLREGRSAAHWTPA